MNSQGRLDIARVLLGERYRSRSTRKFFVFYVFLWTNKIIIIIIIILFFIHNIAMKLWMWKPLTIRYR